jgi:hypothetical protein
MTKETRMRTLGALILAIGLIATTAHANSITYDFTSDVTAGALAGNQYMGEFSYDDTVLTGVGTEYVRPSVGGLAVSLDLEGTVYTEVDDFDYGDPNQFPRLTFNDGVFEHLNWMFSSPFGTVHFTFFNDLEGPVIEIGPDKVGTVSYAVRGSDGVVPEPNAALLFCLGTIVTGSVIRGRLRQEG